MTTMTSFGVRWSLPIATVGLVAAAIASIATDNIGWLLAALIATGLVANVIARSGRRR